MRSSVPIVRSRARRLVAKTGRGLVALLLLATFAALVVTFAPGLFGYQRYVLVGGSMEPSIHRGSIVFDDVVRVRDLRAGDVITYQPPGATKPVTHRIISAEPQKTGTPIFRTQGDANATADMRTFKLNQPTQARYRFSIPYLGWAFILLGTPRARFLLLALPALLIALTMLGRLWREGGQLVAERGTS
jgi:signal peptidase I